jgi:predicted  nucleic acid-binding Zn-ribbon protein
MTDDKRYSIKGDPAHVAAEQERNARWADAADKLGHQMTDIPGLIERLREAVSSPWCSHRTRMLEAADALSRLSEDKKRLEEALAKIVPSFEKLVAETDDEFTASDEEILNAARSALRGE